MAGIISEKTAKKLTPFFITIWMSSQKNPLQKRRPTNKSNLHARGVMNKDVHILFVDRSHINFSGALTKTFIVQYFCDMQ